MTSLREVHNVVQYIVKDKHVCHPKGLPLPRRSYNNLSQLQRQGSILKDDDDRCCVAKGVKVAWFHDI